MNSQHRPYFTEGQQQYHNSIEDELRVFSERLDNLDKVAHAPVDLSSVFNRIDNLEKDTHAPIGWEVVERFEATVSGILYRLDRLEEVKDDAPKKPCPDGHCDNL